MAGTDCSVFFFMNLKGIMGKVSEAGALSLLVSETNITMQKRNYMGISSSHFTMA